METPGLFAFGDSRYQRRNALTDPLGARSRVSGDRFVLDLAADDPDLNEGMAKQFALEALRKANTLREKCKSLANQKAWSDLPVAAELLAEQLHTDPSRYNEHALTFWSLSVSLATFLEQSRNARAGASFAERAADLLIEREVDVREIYASAPTDMKEAANGLLRLTKEELAKRKKK